MSFGCVSWIATVWWSSSPIVLFTDMCFGSAYNISFRSVIAFSVTQIITQLHIWKQEFIVLEALQRKWANDKQRQTLRHCIIWELNLPENPHPEKSLPQQICNSSWTSSGRFRSDTNRHIHAEIKVVCMLVQTEGAKIYFKGCTLGWLSKQACRPNNPNF